MKYLLFAILMVGLCTACSDSEEGLIGEWEGTTERVSSKGKLIEASVSCIISATTGMSRIVILEVAGAKFEFEASESLDELKYTDSPVFNDSTEMSYVTGSAVLLNDTLLRFDHTIYAMKNNALLYSESEEFDMVRKTK